MDSPIRKLLHYTFEYVFRLSKNVRDAFVLLMKNLTNLYMGCFRLYWMKDDQEVRILSFKHNHVPKVDTSNKITTNEKANVKAIIKNEFTLRKIKHYKENILVY